MQRLRIRAQETPVAAICEGGGRGVKDDYSASRTIPSNLSYLSPFNTCKNSETMFSCSRFSYEKKSKVTIPGSGISW